MTTPSNILQGSAGTSAQCSASSELNATYPATEAWDGLSEATVVAAAWISSSDNGPNLDGSCYLQWNFGSTYPISHIRLNRRLDSLTENFPKDIEIFGSNTGTFSGEEDLLGSIQINDAAFNAWSSWFDLTSIGFYQYIRVEIHSMWESGTTQTWVAVQEVEFGYTFPTGFSDSSVDIEVIGYGMTEMSVDIQAAQFIKEGISIDISAYFQSIDDALLSVSTLGEISFDKKIDFFAALQNFKSLPLNVQTAAEQIKNISLNLFLTEGIIRQNAPMDIILGDGNNTTDIGLDIMAVSTMPEFKSIYAMHLNSAIKEVVS